jgi:dipeptidyl aminopeptidase/acylaminoacyl peptidase
MDKELARRGVTHEMITVEDAGHGLSGAKREEIDRAYNQAVAFIKKQVG